MSSLKRWFHGSLYFVRDRKPFNKGGSVEGGSVVKRDPTKEASHFKKFDTEGLVQHGEVSMTQCGELHGLSIGCVHPLRWRTKRDEEKSC